MQRDYVPNFEHCLLPYVQWYQDDFVGGVRGMRAHEIGVYTMLLMEMYMRGRALDQSHDRLARMCGADRRTFEKVIIQLVDDGKIIKLDCGYWNERCENAFRSRAKMQEQNSEAAHRSWKNRKENNEAGKQTQSERNAGAMPSSEAQNIIKETPNGVYKKRPSRLPPDWECPPEWIEEAVAGGLSRAQAINAADRMKNWSLSAAKAVKLDWRATWRNWYKRDLPSPKASGTSKTQLFARM